MARGSDKHTPRVDDDLAQDFENDERAGRPTRPDEWRDPEPPTESFGEAAGKPIDDPELPDMVPGSDEEEPS